MLLPRFVRDILASLPLGAFDTTKRDPSADARKTRELIDGIVKPVADVLVEAAKDELYGGFERITLFAVLFRSQADQSRRLDSVDATLGIVLTTLLALAPIAFEKAPTTADRWITFAGFAVVVLIVGRALFFVGAPEPNAVVLGGKLLGDLKDPVAGSLKEVRAAIRRSADARRPLTNLELRQRGAAGDLAQIIAEDRQRLGLKRFHLGLALILFLILVLAIGWRDVVESATKDSSKDGARQVSHHVVAPTHAAGGSDGDPRVRRHHV
jgi:hypothetical protein